MKTLIFPQNRAGGEHEARRGELVSGFHMEFLGNSRRGEFVAGSCMGKCSPRRE